MYYHVWSVDCTVPCVYRVCSSMSCSLRLSLVSRFCRTLNKIKPAT